MVHEGSRPLIRGVKPCPVAAVYICRREDLNLHEGSAHQPLNVVTDASYFDAVYSFLGLFVYHCDV